MSLFNIANLVHPFQASDWGIQDSGGPFYAGQGRGAEPSDKDKLVCVFYCLAGSPRLGSCGWKRRRYFGAPQTIKAEIIDH